MASILKLGTRWRALVRRRGHKSICKTFPTKAAAVAWAQDVEAQLETGQPAVNPQETVGGLIRKYRALREHSRPVLDTSNEHYILRHLDAGLGGIKVAHLSIDDLVGWCRKRRDEGAGPYTVNIEVSKLGTMMRYAGEGLPDIVGQARPKLTYFGLIGGGGKRERRPTADELERLLEALPARYAEAVRFAVATAMRRSEICGLLWADLDEANRLVLIRDRKHPRKKAGNNEWVPLLGAAWEIVQRQPREGERIFPLHPQTMSKTFKAACDRLSIPGLHFHDLRHEGTSLLFEQGLQIQEVSLVTGHKDWRHLRRYTNLRPEDLHGKVVPLKKKAV